jgi:hypothetical protein
METKELIAMLNKDMADEHAAILRYVVHGYLEGEDTPLGASLLSRAKPVVACQGRDVAHALVRNDHWKTGG